MTDFLMLERLNKVIKDIPKPKLMFRKGMSVKGFFHPYMTFDEYTKARLFCNAEEITPVTVRFASMLGDRGTADTVRNIKSMNVKFHSADGAYDMICHSLPVTFISDQKKFFDMMDALTKNVYFDGVNKAAFWKFVTRNPEAVNCALRFFSHEGLSDSYIYINLFSVNITVWENNKGEKTFVRYKWIPVRDHYESPPRKKAVLDRTSAEFMAGFDPDRGFEQIESCITTGKFPQFELHAQIFGKGMEVPEEYLKNTLLWDDSEIPYTVIGVMKLTELLENDSNKKDLISFSPGNTVNGIEIHENDFNSIMDYMCKVEALERGEQY